MAINMQIYSNVYNTTKTISIDFVANIAAIVDDPSVDDETRYFFKLTTNAKDTSNLSFAPRIVTTLSDLALNKTKQSSADSSNAYANIREMIADFVFDYENGHTADQFSSGCTAKAPMRFSS